jgi:hypothetical protein
MREDEKHKIQVHVTPSAMGSYIKIDRVKVPNVRSIRVNARVNEIATVTLGVLGLGGVEIIGEVGKVEKTTEIPQATKSRQVGTERRIKASTRLPQTISTVRLAGLCLTGTCLRTWSGAAIGDDRDLKILSQANNVFSEILAA